MERSNTIIVVVIVIAGLMEPDVAIGNTPTREVLVFQPGVFRTSAPGPAHHVPFERTNISPATGGVAVRTSCQNTTDWLLLQSASLPVYTLLA